MNRILLRWALPTFLLLHAAIAGAQQKDWVLLKDKPNGSCAMPGQIYSPEIWQQKQAHGRVFEVTDAPVEQQYIAAIAEIADSLGYASRWMNAQAVWTHSPEQRAKLRALPFVAGILPMSSEPMRPASLRAEAEGKIDTAKIKLTAQDLKLLERQKAFFGDTAAQRHELTGKGVRIAVLDIGFKNVNIHPAFAHIRARGGIIKTYDFVRRREDVYYTGFHGTNVLSCIAGKTPDGKDIGLAPDAEFLLAKTERLLTELKSEEDNWIAAVEWAEQNGAQLVSSSLGYTKQRYFTEDMDGHTSMIARAANMAARKGMLVINSAGNDGTNDWRVICTPADGDSVLAVGGINPYTGYHSDFSSYGPGYPNKLKPNVCAVGTAFMASPKAYTKSDGTSYSCPLVTGYAACMIQARPDLRGALLLKEVEKAGHIYPYFDYAHGYGVPQLAAIVPNHDTARLSALSIDTSGTESIFIRVDSAEYVRAAAQFNNRGKTLLYVHQADANNFLLNYKVYEFTGPGTLEIPEDEIKPGTRRLRFSYGGIMREISLNEAPRGE